MDIIDKINKTKDPWQIIYKLTLKQLTTIIKIASDHYYNTSNPLLSDEVYDMLIDKLKMDDPKNPWFKNIGFDVRGSKVKLPYWMGSLEKFKEYDYHFDKWIDFHDPPYVISDKLDGISGLLTNKSGNYKLYTRGTGSEGKDISHLLKYLKLDLSKIKGKIAIRGELIMNRNVFKKKYSSKMKNPRNMVSGIALSKESTLNKSVNDLEFVAYEIIYPEYSPSDQFNHLKKYNIKSAYNKTISNELDLNKLDKLLVKRRILSDYDIDGIVITHDKLHQRNKHGNPSYSFAYKGITETAIVNVVEVIWEESKDGYLNPVVNFEPVNLSQVTITNATGFNAKFIVDNKIGPGAKIKIIRKNDTIPKILEVIKPAKTPGLPTHIKYHWSRSGVYIIIDNLDDNKTVNVKRLLKFMTDIGVTHMGEGIIKKLVEHGYKTPFDMIKMTVSDIIKIDGFKETLANKLISNIRKATSKIDVLTLMTASNLLGRGLGKKKLEIILENYPHIIEDYNESKKKVWKLKLMELPGFNDLTVMKFLDCLPDYIKFHKKFIKYCEIKSYKKITKKNGKFNDEIIVFTGFRNKNWENEIKKEGGKVSTSISKNTTLVVYDPSVIGKEKYNKAEQLKIKMIEKSKFEKLLP